MRLPRLRQAVLAAQQLTPVTDALEAALGVHSPFRDEGVGHFGLGNAVYAVGDCFVEVVSPLRKDTAAGRQIDRRGGDCGYMAMFELADAPGTRARLADLGVRVVFSTEHDDIVDLHLHPKDVPGAIVALDITDPPGSWRWGGPDWTGAIPAHAAGGLTGLTVAVADPVAAAERWAAVLGVAVTDDATLVLGGGTQRVQFMTAADPSAQGIVGVAAAVAGRTGAADIAGVRFSWTSTEDAS
jgi:hypothetical protein